MNTDGQWYYLASGGSRGPEPMERLLELLESKTISPSTPVWKEGNADWQPIELVLRDVGGSPPPLPGHAQAAIQPLAPTIPAIDPQKLAGRFAFTDSSPHPWRRYFARVLDTLSGGTATWFLLNLLVAAVDQDTSKSIVQFSSDDQYKYLLSAVIILLASFPNALFIGLTGSSIGKWLFGIKVMSSSNSVLGFKVAFSREMIIFVKGWGLGLPIVYLFTMIAAYKNLKADGEATWDRDLGAIVTQRPSSTGQTLMSLTGAVLWLILYVFLIALAYGK
jgi:hypothetical protein